MKKNSNTPEINLVLSTFDASRVESSLQEQNVIMENIFPNKILSIEATKSEQKALNCEEQHILDLYKSFQQSRIPSREENIDVIIANLKCSGEKETIASNVHRLPKRLADGISTRFQYFATAALLVVSLTAALFVLKTPQPTNLFDYAVNQLTRTEYNGKIASIEITYSVLSFSTKANSGSEAFILGVSSIDLPVLLASYREQEANRLVDHLESLALNENNTLIRSFLKLAQHRPFDISHFQESLKNNFSSKPLNKVQDSFYHLGRWVESCILATEVALSDNDYSLLNTLLRKKPTISKFFPDEINRLLQTDNTITGTKDSVSKTREIQHQLMLIKGYF